MQVKRSTLKLTIIITVVILVVGSVCLSEYNKKHKKEQQRKELESAVRNMIDSKYKELLWEYEYEVKIALDYDYSSSTRDRAVRNINRLFGYQFYDRDSWESFSSQYNKKNDKALIELKSKAAQMVREELWK